MFSDKRAAAVSLPHLKPCSLTAGSLGDWYKNNKKQRLYWMQFAALSWQLKNKTVLVTVRIKVSLPRCQQQETVYK